MTSRAGRATGWLLALGAAAVAGGCIGGGGGATSGRWRALPEVAPEGEKCDTGSFLVADRAAAKFARPKVVDDPRVTTGRKKSRVAVLIYDPVLECEGGKRMIDYTAGVDPVECSHILADVVREASWGYLTYEIAEVIVVDGYPTKVDGFKYTDETFLVARDKQEWQPSGASYRAMLEENGLLAKVQSRAIDEVWVWGCGGMHMDEFAMYIPNRAARFGPTDNAWLYRPYDIPPECGRTLWMMGFNYEVGPDNMVHSYSHRVESMGALQFGDGIWDTKGRDDPWNRFSRVEMDSPGTVSEVGNCHVPPNGQEGYDYSNTRRVLCNADAWSHYPDLTGKPRLVSSQEWGNTHFGYQKWLLEHLPKFPGADAHGYFNWWVYIANTDEELEEMGGAK
jgi:hypothetical protein